MTEDEGGRSPAFWIALVVGGLVVVAFVLLILVAVVGSFVVEMGDASSDVQPDASLSFDAGEGRITHEKGEPINASRLVVEANGERIGTWAELSGGDERVEVGDQLRLSDLENGDQITVLLHGDDQSVPVGTFEYEG